MVKIVEASIEYWDFIRIMRTCKDNTNGFEQQVEISTEQQIKYMQRNSKNYYVCIDGDTPVGFVGCIDGDIRVATHPEHKKKGYGKLMINFIFEKFPESYAKVKIDNDASLELFKSCGFEKKYIILKK